ncbi:hypothetical protein ACFQ0B_53935 [Nonomuraea thailandensis]
MTGNIANTATASGIAFGSHGSRMTTAATTTAARTSGRTRAWRIIMPSPSSSGEASRSATGTATTSDTVSR